MPSQIFLIMDAYRDGNKLDTREFTDRVFKQHHRVQLHL